MPQRVLLVHEDAAVRDLSQRTLARLGVEVDVVPRGADAVAALDAKDYSVAVVDRALCDDFFAAVAKRDEKPIVICAGAERDGLDPAVVNLLVPHPYDAPTLVGVILACVSGPPRASAPS